MTQKEPQALDDAIERAFEMYPFENEDFDSDGFLTDDARKRATSAILEVIPKEALRAKAEEIIGEQIGMYMEELAALRGEAGAGPAIGLGRIDASLITAAPGEALSELCLQCMRNSQTFVKAVPHAEPAVNYLF